MVDAENRVFGEVLNKRAVERTRRFEIAPERLFDDNARVQVEPACGERRPDRAEQSGRDREIMQRPPGGPQRLLERLEGLRVVIVAIDIIQELDQARESGLAEVPVTFEAVPGAGPKLFEIPAGFRHPDDRDVEAFLADQSLKRWKDLLVRQVAGRAEE